MSDNTDITDIAPELPILISIEKVATSSDIVGAVAYETQVQYHGTVSTYTFIGSMFGSPGPVLLVFPNTAEVEVFQPERYGVRFNDDWVRNFYA